MRRLLVGLSVLCGSLSVLNAPATAQVSVQLGWPGVHIGINLPVYPELVPVPGYPVYYAPRLPSNYFFYDGYYWVYYGDDWYMSSWYNGPWMLVEPDYVPIYVLRVPVRYYRQPPPYFRSWHADAPPRWGDRWGDVWEREHHGWDRWNHRNAPPPAPLPRYQRDYRGDRYPQQIEQQRELHDQHYRYRSVDPDVRRIDRVQPGNGMPAPQPSTRSRPQPNQPREWQREDQREWPRDNPRDGRDPRDDRRSVPREAPRDAPRDVPRESPRWHDDDAPPERGHKSRDDRGEMRQPGRVMVAPDAPAPRQRATVMPEPRPVPYQNAAPRGAAPDSAPPPRERGRSRDRDQDDSPRSDRDRGNNDRGHNDRDDRDRR